jgi:16S rRNA (guanine1207-N2)-methyltransferase
LLFRKKLALFEHYFTCNPSSSQDLRILEVDYNNTLFFFQTDTGVFSRDGLDPGSRLLLDVCIPLLSGRVLDLGCGWGAIGIIATRLCAECQVILTDINQRAVELAKHNAQQNGIQTQIVLGDGLEALSGQFHWILLNPPIRAGKQTVYRLFKDSAQRLYPGGILAVVIRKQQGAPSARDYLNTLFSNVTLKARKKGYHVYLCEVERK